MKCLLFFIFLFSFSLSATTEYVAVEGGHNEIWSKYSPSSRDNVSRLIDLLSRSKEGANLIDKTKNKAAQVGLTILDVVEVGEGSITDTTLIRRFHPEQPEKVAYETKSKVFINRHLAWREAILDLAHELTHYLYREAFNPYTVNFSLAEFIKSTIDAEGGEVHAFVTECRVMRELFTREFLANSSCSAIQDEKGDFSVTKTSHLFYQVGAFYDQLKSVLKPKGLMQDFKQLTANKIKFVSSAYGLPYPLAAMYEYESVVAKVCENDKKRLAYMQQSAQRSPASLETFKSEFQNRCSTVI